MIVLGIDPGGRSVGWVIRAGRELVDFGVETLDGDLVDRSRHAAEVLLHLRCKLDAVAADRPGVPVRIGVEGLRPPTGHLGRVAPAAVMGVAAVLGAIVSHAPDAVIVPPGRHGAAPLIAYPAELVGRRETSGTGKLRHARSAWDVARVAARMRTVP